MQVNNRLTRNLEEQSKCPICPKNTNNDLTVISKCQHLFCENCQPFQINHHEITECPECHIKFEAKQLVNEGQSQATIESLSENGAHFENKENAYTQVQAIFENAKEIIVDQTVHQVSATIIQNPTHISHVIQICDQDQPQLNRSYPYISTMSTQNERQKTPQVSLKPVFQEDLTYKPTYTVKPEAVKICNNDFTAINRYFNSLYVNNDIVLTECRVQELSRSQQGSLTAVTCTFGSIKTFSHIKLTDCNVGGLVCSLSGNISLTNCKVTGLVWSQSGNISMNNCSAKKITAYHDIELENKCKIYELIISHQGNIYASDCFFKNVNANYNIKLNHCIATGKVKSFEGALNATKSILFQVDVCCDATLKKCSGIKVVSRQGAIETKSTASNFFQELCSYKDIKIQSTLVCSAISTNGKVLKENC